jgi:hypothetical protein
MIPEHLRAKIVLLETYLLKFMFKYNYWKRFYELFSKLNKRNFRIHQPNVFIVQIYSALYRQSYICADILRLLLAIYGI